jgi:hypothetical protein
LLVRSLGWVPPPVGRYVCGALQRHPAVPDRWGFHVRRMDYHEPLPDFPTLPRGACATRRPPLAIPVDVAVCVARAAALVGTVRGELNTLAENRDFDFANEYFSAFDACLYYAMLRATQPARVIEVGSGYSTTLACHALQRNAADGRPGQLTCIDPAPRQALDRLPVRWLTTPVEHVESAVFQALGSGDILFLDSSHAVRFGGDVCCEILRVLPTLAAGVLVHIHDIFWPYDYPTEWVLGRRLAYGEQYLLEAFLSFNPAFRVLVPASWLVADEPAAVAAMCPPAARPTDPVLGRSSLWIERLP